MPADSASEIVKFTISIPRESCTNAKAKYSSSVVPPDPSVHFYHCNRVTNISKSFAYKMVAKTSWHRYGTKLCHCHPVYMYKLIAKFSTLDLASKLNSKPVGMCNVLQHNHRLSLDGVLCRFQERLETCLSRCS